MKIKNIVKSGLKTILFLSVILVILVIKHELFDNPVTFAQSISDPLSEIEQESQLPTFSETHERAAQKPGLSRLTTIIYTVLDFMKFLIGSVAFIMVIYEVIKIIIARKQIDDVKEKAKNHLVYIVTAFVIIMIADYLVKNVFFGVEGEVFTSEEQAQVAAQQGSELARNITNVILTVSGVLAILMVIITGVQLVMSMGSEDVQTKAKKRLTWLIIGLVVLGVARFAVYEVIFPAQGEVIPDTERFTWFVVKATNFLSAFIVIGAILSFIYGGILYVISVGDDNKTQKAKKVFIGALIALIIAMAAFAIVNTLIKLEPGT